MGRLTQYAGEVCGEGLCTPGQCMCHFVVKGRPTGIPSERASVHAAHDREIQTHALNRWFPHLAACQKYLRHSENTPVPTPIPPFPNPLNPISRAGMSCSRFVADLRAASLTGGPRGEMAALLGRGTQWPPGPGTSPCGVCGRDAGRTSELFRDDGRDDGSGFRTPTWGAELSVGSPRTWPGPLGGATGTLQE